MKWFNRPSPEYINITPPKGGAKKEIPKDFWHKCPACGTLTLQKDFVVSYSVCPGCGRHERIKAKDRIRLIVDPGTFKETHKGLLSKDPLKFETNVKYAEKLEESRKKTGQNEAVLVGTAEIGEVPVSLAIMDFFFMGGSMGSVVGEKIARAMEYSLENNVPCIALTASGGARMQEGILSLMQMAKTSILCARLQDANIPFISILTDPSTGGTMASFASLGDVIMAEPGAYIGFAGKRVIENTIKQQLPKDFQTAEFQKEHGFVDLVVERREMRATLIRLLRMMTGRPVIKEESSPESDEIPKSTPVANEL